MHLAKKLQVMTFSGNFHVSPRESVLQRFVVLLADGDRSQAEPHRHCGSGECYKPTEHHVQLRLDLDMYVKHARLKRFFLLQMCFSSTLETRLLSLLLFSPTSVSQRLLFFSWTAASSADAGMPTVIKDLEKNMHLMAYSG